jgi:hypothetical protein
VEHRLFSDAREAEAQRKKQSQVVGKMQGELEHLKRENAKRLKVVNEEMKEGRHVQCHACTLS